MLFWKLDRFGTLGKNSSASKTVVNMLQKSFMALLPGTNLIKLDHSINVKYIWISVVKQTSLQKEYLN